MPLDLPPDGTKQVLTLPPSDQLPGLSPTYFVHLIIKDASGKQVGANFYWLSTEARDAGLREDQVVRHPDQEPTPTSPPWPSCPR